MNLEKVQITREKLQTGIFKVLLIVITFTVLVLLIRDEGFFFGIH